MSMDGRIQVDLARISESAADIETKIAQIDQALADINSSLQPLMSSWSGEAATAYQTLKQRQDSSWNDLQEIWRAIPRALRTASDSMGGAEQKIAQSWQP